MDDRSVYVSREELYAMVWATQMQKLAKEFGISDVALAKTCKKLGVPRPPRGHWARKAAGQTVKATALPARGAKQRDGVYLSRASEPKPVIELSEGTVALIEHLMIPENIMSISETLDKPHPLVRRTMQALSKSKIDMYGALWGSYGCLDLRLSKQSLARALLFMDAVLRQLEKLGYEVTVPESGKTVIAMGDVEMGISLYERFTRFEQLLTEKQKKDWWHFDKYRFEPSGEFDLTLSRWPLHDRHWRDTPKRKLEDRLTDIMVEIVRSTELVRIENDRREVERLLRLEQQRLEAERIQKEIDENRRREELETQASRWRAASELRTFIQACEMEFSRQKSADLEFSESTWLRWAYQHADRLDPIKNGYLERVLIP